MRSQLYSKGIMQILDKFLKLRSFVNQVESRLDSGLVYGVSFNEFVIMRALVAADSEGMRRSDLAATVGLSVSGLTRALQPLEKLGYVERRDALVDARERRVALSKTAAALYSDIEANVLSRLADRADEITKITAD
ncbi:MarR family transcriptional regulator [Rhodoluna sp.]|uniref:MarR family winged helix-turn-helix transcriptional regulator n=1 Tax=Rhodoluna sp. TaxID=1969481 RepID=UPI0025F1BCD9|nr:MarR family transcriptional regulator [Rhodoluna sp.]